MKSLVIAEKPSVAREIARVLGCRDRKNGYIAGNGYYVSWAVGHLATLAMPEDYDENLKKWRAGDLPVMPKEMKLKTIDSSKKQFTILKDLLNKKDVSEVICATDAGREGELIFRYIYQLAECNKPVKRLWISSLTNQAIKQGLQNLKPGSNYDNLYHAARCRAEADWLVGLNATRAYTVKFGTLLSAGRVQTPTLALITSREKEIQGFKPKDFYEVYAHYQEGFTGRWQGEDNGSRITNKAKAENIVSKISGKNGFIQEINQVEKRERPPLLYDLTELQRDGNKRYGLTAQETLNIAQNLYEKKLITYPRTNSRYLSSDISVNSILSSLQGYKSYTDRIKDNGWEIQGRSINGSKVTDHHAIIPTGEMKELAGKENAVFNMVAIRFIANFFPDYEFTDVIVTTEINAEIFNSKGRVIRQQGWKELYSDDDEEAEDEESGLPLLNKGDELTVSEAELKQKKTSPPKKYTEAGILSAMENAGKFIEDEELRDAMKENGLGTPATRAAILERLIKVGYIERKGKTLIPTKKGIAVASVMPAELKSPELTGTWEKKLYDIEKGILCPEDYMAEIKEYTQEIVAAAKNSQGKIIADNAKIVVGKCPVCDADVIKNKSGYGCSAWRKEGCKFFIGMIAGKKLTVKQARELLEKGMSGKLKGFISKKGKKFEAALELQEGKIKFIFH